MVRINNIKVPLDFDFTKLKELCGKKFGIDTSKIKSVKLSKKSVDARKKNDVHFIISLDIEARNEEQILKRIKGAVAVEEYKYEIKKSQCSRKSSCNSWLRTGWNVCCVDSCRKRSKTNYS